MMKYGTVVHYACPDFAKLLDEIHRVRKWCNYLMRMCENIDDDERYNELIFRNPETQPARNIFQEGSVPNTTMAEAERLIHVLNLRRDTALAGIPYNDGQLTSYEDEGALVAFAPDLSLMDGSAESETFGFFDAVNEPPWDSWIRCVPAEEVSLKGEFFDRVPYFLLSWVPKDFETTIDYALYCNYEECIVWCEVVPSLTKGRYF
jgi:hypothetical protein